MAKWTAFPYDNAEYTHDAAALKKHWARLHAGDAEPLPKDDKVLAAYVDAVRPLVTEALDRFLAELPGLEDLARRKDDAADEGITDAELV